MATRTGKVILAKNIFLDRNYNNILNYSESDMVNLVNSKKIKEYVNCSFIKQGENTIKVSGNYGDIMKANYLAFQNPDYSNKWFFAFIDKVDYISEDTCHISFTIDEHSTWFSYFDANMCFVEREHVNNDAIGLNTVPENLETGEYICNEHTKDENMDQYAGDLCYIMASTSQPLAGEAKDTVAPSGIYNGIYTGLGYYRYNNSEAIDIILEIFANYAKTKAINGIFMAPKWLAPYVSGTILSEVIQSDTPATYDITINKNYTLNGYNPVNNKLKCFPYNYFLVSNNVGQNAILHYEKFSTSNMGFTVRGVLNPGCSINLTPNNYNGSVSSDIDAIQLGKFPICNFQNDMYTNWLTQNSINILGQTLTTDDLNIASDILGGISGGITNLATGNMLGLGMTVANTFQSTARSLMQKKQHNMIPPSTVGQLNSADVNVASGNNTFHFYKMSVKYEYARIIDQFFTRYGYQVNQLKVPNRTGRTNWNFVKIGDGENIVKPNGTISVPMESETVINQIYRNGTTVWHNHDNIGNYNLSNTIVS